MGVYFYPIGFGDLEQCFETAKTRGNLEEKLSSVIVESCLRIWAIFINILFISCDLAFRQLFVYKFSF